MTFKSVFVAALICLFGCSGIESFENDLVDSEVRAWKVCEGEIAKDWTQQAIRPPANTIQTSEYIMFAWDRKEMEKEGGPVYCMTDIQGLEVIELKVTNGSF